MNLAASAYYNHRQAYLNIWWQGAFLLSVMAAINAILSVIDPRLLGDEAVWLKPLKFEISVILHFITLAVLASLLSAERRNTKTWQCISYAAVAAGIFEVLYIFLQAARGRESHFNISTPMEGTMYALMGLGALTLVFASFYLGCVLYKEYRVERSSPLLLSSALGLTIGSVLTLIIAGYLSSKTGTEIVLGTEQSPRAPLFGWYLGGKDLRIPHFLATHMMQIMPLIGLWLSRNHAVVQNVRTKLYSFFAASSATIIMIFVISFYA